MSRGRHLHMRPPDVYRGILPFSRSLRPFPACVSRAAIRGIHLLASALFLAAFSFAPANASPGGLKADPDNFIDTEFLASGALEMINAQYAYARGYTGKGVLVAVLDSGLFAAHPEFAGQVAGGRNFDNDQPWWDYSDTELNDEGEIDGHGTHVAGIIAAARDGRGMHGVAYNSQLYILRVDSDNDAIGIQHAIDVGAKVFNGSYGPDGNPPKEIEDPDNPGEKIDNPHYTKDPANASYLKYQVMLHKDTIAQAETLRKAAAADIVLVFAAGNDFDDYPAQASHVSGYGMFHLINPDYVSRPGEDPLYRFINPDAPNQDENNPATYVFMDFNDARIRDLDFSDLGGSMLSVVAVGPEGDISYYSNRCGDAWLYCLAAPGGDLLVDDSDGAPIWSTHPEASKNYYETLQGTSMAAPVVAGAAAVVREAFPYMSARQIIETILTTSDNTGKYSDADIYGRGLLDLGKAVLGPGEFGAEGFGTMFLADTKGFDSVFGNDIEGSGGLRKSGGGTLWLTGFNTYEGDTIVDEGRLAVDNNTTASKFIIKADGTLAGSGDVGPTQVFGRVAPGNSIGTLTFVPIPPGTTALRAEPGSVFEIEVDGRGRSDILDVQGDAELQGGEVLLLGLNGAVLGQQYDFMTVTGTVLGPGFDGARNNYVFADINLQQAGNLFRLNVQRNQRSFASLGRNRNQRHSAAAIEALGAGALPYETLITLQDARAASNYYEQFSGELHASARNMLYADAGMLRQGLRGRMAQVAQGLPAVRAKAAGTWGQGLASWSRHDGAGISHSARRFGSGLMLGHDFSLADHSHAGVALAYTHTRVKAEQGNQANIDGWHLLAYGNTQIDAVNLRAGLGHSWYRLDTRRHISANGLGSHKARYGAQLTQIFVEAGLPLSLAHMELEPYAGVTQQWLRSRGFRESGPARLHGKAGQHQLTQTQLGMRGRWTLESSGANLAIEAAAAWVHTFGSLSTGARLTFEGGRSHEILGAPLARNALHLELKAGVLHSTRTRLDLGYAGQIGNGVQDHGFRLQLSHRF